MGTPFKLKRNVYSSTSQLDEEDGDQQFLNSYQNVLIKLMDQ